jgi:hypothetical protein
MSYITPWSGQLASGTYEISVPAQVTVSNVVYNFSHWEDNSTANVRTISLTADKTITVTYVAAPTFTVTFSGGVNAQANSAETVTITVTKPDSTTDTVTAATRTDKTYSVSKSYVLLGNYSAVASIAADNVYKAAVSPAFQFTVGLTDRAITLTAAIT